MQNLFAYADHHIQLTGDVLTILIGPDEIHFHVHESVLSRRARRPMATFRPQASEMQPFKLPDITCAVFELYLQQLYEGTLPSPTRGESAQQCRELAKQQIDTFIELYSLAVTFDDPTAKDLASSGILEIYRTALSNHDSYLPVAESVAKAYSTSGCTKLRQLFVDIYMLESDAFSISGTMPQQFLVDFGEACCRKMSELQGQIGCGFWKISDCEYHEHANGTCPSLRETKRKRVAFEEDSTDEVHDQATAAAEVGKAPRVFEAMANGEYLKAEPTTSPIPCVAPVASMLEPKRKARNTDATWKPYEIKLLIAALNSLQAGIIELDFDAYEKNGIFPSKESARSNWGKLKKKMAEFTSGSPSATPAWPGAPAQDQQIIWSELDVKRLIAASKSLKSGQFIITPQAFMKNAGFTDLKDASDAFMTVKHKINGTNAAAEKQDSPIEVD